MGRERRKGHAEERRAAARGARAALWVGAAAALASGCSLGLLGGGGPVAEVRRDGVVYWAETSIVAADPVRIQTIVGATNRRRHTVRVATIACPVFVRLYDSPVRVGLPVWDEEPAYVRWTRRHGRGAWQTNQSCRGGGRPVSIPPGESTWLTIAAVEPAGMGERIPPGRYYFTVVVPLEGRRIELISGESELGGGATGVSDGRGRVGSGESRGPSS